MALSSESLRYIVDHVFLPPKLPQEAETVQVEQQAGSDLLALILREAQVFNNLLISAEAREAWDTIIKTFQSWTNVAASGCIPELLVARQLADMAPTGKCNPETFTAYYLNFSKPYFYSQY